MILKKNLKHSFLNSQRLVKLLSVANNSNPFKTIFIFLNTYA